MKISSLIRFLSCMFVASALSLTALAQTAAGQIKAAKIEGLVQKISAAGATTTLKDGDVIAESDTINTGKGASVVLVFMNGSSVKLGSDTRLAIDEFKMDPLAEDVAAKDLKAEPSVSKTTLNLAYGEMVGDVKKLNKSSSYSIKTPVGAAGIRGTIYRIVFTPSSDGKAYFTVTTAEGHVVMTGVAQGEVPVNAGSQVVVEVDTNSPSTPKVVTQDIPPATQTVISDATKAIVQVLATTTLNSTGVVTTPITTPITVGNTTTTTTTVPVPPDPSLSGGAGGTGG